MRRRMRRLQRSLEHTDFGLVPSLLAAEREECQRQRIAFLRAVEYLPIAQFAARAQREIAGADAAQGESQGAGAMVVASDAFVMFHLITLCNVACPITVLWRTSRFTMIQAPFSPLRVTPSTSLRWKDHKRI